MADGLKRDTVIGLFLALFFVGLFLFAWSHSFWSDELRYLAVAQGIQEYGFPVFLGFNFYLHPSLFMYLIAVVDLGIHNLLLAGELIVLLFTFLAIFLFYKLGKLFFDTFYSVLFTIFSACSFAFVWSATHIQMEILLIFFYVAVVYLVFKFEQEYSTKYLLALGVMLGLGLLTKASMLLLLFVTVIYLAFLLYKKNSFLLFFQKMAQFLLIPLLLVLPLLVYRFLNNAPLYLGPELLDTAIFGNNHFAQDVGYYFVHIFDLIHPVLFLLFLIGLIFLIKNNLWRKFSFIFLLLSFTFVVTSLGNGKIPRYLYQIVPLMILISLYGLQQLFSFSNLKLGFNLQKIAVILLLVLVFVPSFYELFESSTGIENWQVWRELNSVTGNESVLIEGNQYMAGAVFGNVYPIAFLGPNFIGRQTQLGFHYLLLPLEDYSGISENQGRLELIKSYSDCNCGIYSLINPPLAPFSISIVDEYNRPLRNAFYQVIFVADPEFDPFNKETLVRGQSLISKYINRQVDVYSRAYTYKDKQFIQSTIASLSDVNGLIHFSNVITDDKNSQFVKKAVFTKGFLFVSKLCYAQVQIPFLISNIDGVTYPIVCDNQNNCHILDKIELSPKNCWLNSLPSFS